MSDYAAITTDATATDMAADTGTSILGGGDDTTATTADDLSSIFTPEEVESKREAIKAAKAEEDRRAGLTDEERQAEDDAKAADAKKGEVPEEYADFTLPDGMTVDKNALAEALPLFKELRLTQDQAQKLVELQTRVIAKQAETWTNTLTDWTNTAKSDKEYGGDKFQENVTIAQRAINTFGTPELKQALDQYGIGNHPEMVRLMYRIGKAMTEDKIINPGTVSGDTSEGRMQSFYDKSQMK